MYLFSMLMTDCSIRALVAIVPYYAGIMLNVFSDLLFSTYAGIIGWCCVINDYIIILFATCSYIVIVKGHKAYCTQPTLYGYF